MACSSLVKSASLSQVRDNLLIRFRQVHRLAERLGPIHTRLPIHLHLVVVRIFEIKTDGIAVADGANDRYVVFQKLSVKFFDVRETGATERDLLHDLSILSARHQQQLVMLFETALSRHESAARFRILVADLQAKHIPIECFGTLDVSYVETYMTQ